jgi:hypothetical protein
VNKAASNQTILPTPPRTSQGAASVAVETAPPPTTDSEQIKTIEAQAARIIQLEDLLRQANEVIGVQSTAIKKQEQVIIGQVGQINQMRIQIQQARRN